jgi:hypothetical protein
MILWDQPDSSSLTADSNTFHLRKYNLPINSLYCLFIKCSTVDLAGYEIQVILTVYNLEFRMIIRIQEVLWYFRFTFSPFEFKTG